MLFRYKIQSCGYVDVFDRINNGYAFGYHVTIQYFKPDAKWFKWRKFINNRLSDVLDSLGHKKDNMYFVEDLDNALNQYSSVGDIMLKYIKKEIEERNLKSKQHDLANKIDDIILTNGWNTIEIKECE